MIVIIPSGSGTEIHGKGKLIRTSNWRDDDKALTYKEEDLEQWEDFYKELFDGNESKTCAALK